MLVNQTELLLKRGDITEEEVDIIVNAANSGLLGGGGVDGAIHRKGGPAILEECKIIRQTKGRCKTGSCVATGAGTLPAKYVIHTVGPVWSGGSKGEAGLLESAYLSSLKLAEELGVRSIAFPSISTGAYRFPVTEAANVALGACCRFAKQSNAISEIRFILFSERDLEVYRQALEQIGNAA